MCYDGYLLGYSMVNKVIFDYVRGRSWVIFGRGFDSVVGIQFLRSSGILRLLLIFKIGEQLFFGS